MVRKGPARQWYVCFYEASRAGWYQGMRLWKPIHHGEDREPREEAFITRDQAIAHALEHNSRVAQLSQIAMNDARAIVLFGRTRPARVIEWSIQEDQVNDKPSGT